MNRLILALLLLSSSAFADAIPFNLVVVTRPDISTARQIDLFYQGIAPLQKEVGTTIKVTAILETSDVVSKNHLNDYVSRLYSWVNWADRAKIRNRAQHVHFLLPPVVADSGVSFQGGVAGALCSSYRMRSRNFSYSIIRDKNDGGLDRTDASIHTVRHEVLHNLGAAHWEGKPNVMRSAYRPGPKPVAPITKRQVNYCRKGRTVQGRNLRLIVDEPMM